ncbi:MAG: hypothetical protein FWH33_03930 [Oscillospiraceae bacterium]|nr:hypothetical protein [Oscillospiraceae bacterium]
MKRTLPVLKFVIPIIVLLFLLFKNDITIKHEIRLAVNQLPSAREFLQSNDDLLELLLQLMNRISVFNNTNNEIQIHYLAFRVDSGSRESFSIELDSTPSIYNFDADYDTYAFLFTNGILEANEIETVKESCSFLDIVITEWSISIVMARKGRAYLTLWHPLDIYDVISRVDENNQYTTDKMDATYWHLEIFNDDWFIEIRYMQRN